MQNGMSKQEAELVFQLAGEYDLEKLRASYRERIREYHPDRAVQNGMSFDRANDLMVTVNEAYVLLRSQFEGSNKNGTVVSTIPAEEADESTDPPDESLAEDGALENDLVPEDEGPLLANEPPEDERPVGVFKNKVLDILELVAELTPFGFIIGILSWTLPFYLFGGLNIYPTWDGVYEPDGIAFLIVYLVIPALGAWCFALHSVVDASIRTMILGLVSCFK